MRVLLGIGCAVLLWGGMADHRVFMADVNPLGWKTGDAVTAEFPNGDTVSFCDLYVVVRYDERAAGREVPLTVETLAPDSLAVGETITVRIPRRTFDRAIERNSVFFEREEPYRLRARLQRQGVYRFRFTPVGTTPVEGIAAIGIRAVPDGGR